ncbi:hypothetical protein BLOT_015798 [Blomia tropicalis]|nr:hypothetical protein BLOT_015798 [Blomia tropicalis]
MFDIVHIDTVRGLVNDAFTRFVWAMTSKATTEFNYVNLIQQVKQIDKQKVIVVYKTYINTNISKSGTGDTNNWIDERINGDKNWTTHAKQCVNQQSILYLYLGKNGSMYECKLLTSSSGKVETETQVEEANDQRSAEFNHLR